MGYILKTTFWLGMVYSAMPFGEMPAVSLPASPVADASLCAAVSAALMAKLGSVAEPYRDAAAAGCAEFASLRSEAAPAPAPASSNSLTPNDKKPPWNGPRRASANL
jgi:hypothetical protein